MATKEKKTAAPRKKKRRLKKSVKRGCLGIVFFILLFVGLTVYECTRPQPEPEVPEFVWVEGTPDATDTLMAERIAKLVRTPLRIDTNKLAISVYDLQRHAQVYSYHSQALMPPASCMKLLIAIAALKGLGCDHHYESRLYMRGEVMGDTLHGDILLCLDDDPEIESLAPFADALRQRGIVAIDGHSYLHLVRRDTLRQHPTAKPWDIPYRKLSLLLKGEKVVEREWERLTHTQPSPQREGVTLLPTESLQLEKGDYNSPSPRGEGWGEVVFTLRHPLLQPMTPMLTNSSNIKAESIFYHLHHRTPRWEGENSIPPYSVAQFLQEEMHVNPQDFVVNDGSGLSPDNRLTAHFLTRLLVYAYWHDDIWHTLVRHTLATPGCPRRGSLQGRMAAPLFRGKIYCKTGTLTTCGVSSLSGYAQGADGRWYAFSILHDDTPVLESRHFQDLLCKELIR